MVQNIYYMGTILKKDLQVVSSGSLILLPELSSSYFTLPGLKLKAYL